MNTRELFRSAATWVAAHPVPERAMRPAFVSRAGDPRAIPAPPPGARGATRTRRLPTVAGVARDIRDGRLTARDALARSLERIAALNATLRAFVAVREHE